MLRIIGITALLWAVVALSACGSDVGKDGTVVGGPCTGGSGCAGGSSCLTSTMYPGGMCTLNCTSAADCPDGAKCVQESGGTCLLACSSASDCRDGYGCNEKSTLPDGHAFVCIR